jgi:hypothetical protein
VFMLRSKAEKRRVKVTRLCTQQNDTRGDTDRSRERGPAFRELCRSQPSVSNMPS